MGIARVNTKGQRLASQQCIKDNKLNEIALLYQNSREIYCNEPSPLFDVVCSVNRLSIGPNLKVKCQKIFAVV